MKFPYLKKDRYVLDTQQKLNSYIKSFPKKAASDGVKLGDTVTIRTTVKSGKAIME